MNKCAFTGRLTRDPELKVFDGGDKKVRFGVAVSRRFKDKDGNWQDDPSFLEFEAWDTGAQTIADRYKKGSFILIDDCSIKTERWKDKKTGENREKHVYRVNHFELLPKLNWEDRDEKGDPDGGKAASRPPRPKAPGGGKADPEPAPDEPDGVPAGGVDEDIPF